MNRASVRSSPAGGRGSHTCQVSDEFGTHSPANGKMMEDRKLHSDITSSPILRSLSGSPSVQDYLLPAKNLMQNGNAVNGNGIHKSDYLPAPDAMKPCLSLSPSGRGRRYAVPLGSTMLLCFLCAFLFIGMLGSRNRAYNLRLVPTLGIYRSHRKLQAELVVDPFKGGIFGQGSVRMKELPSCESSYEDYVPCYEQGVGSSTERHCGAFNERKQCLIPPPNEYRVPPRWPESRNGVRRANMKLVNEAGLSGKRLGRLKFVADNMATLDLAAEHGGLENHVQQVLHAISKEAGSKHEMGVILDINCGLSRLREKHSSIEKSSILCVAPYEANGSQVQYALERGYPAFVGSPSRTQLPLPCSSFDMIHVLDSVLDWTWKDGLILLELDRLLKPGGFLAWSFDIVLPSESLVEKIKDMATKICWSTVLEAPQTLMLRKTADQGCYFSRSLDATPKICSKFIDVNVSWYPPLRPCITHIAENSTKVIHQLQLANGFSTEEVSGDPSVWAATVKSYWSLLTPIIFSDHPKRPGEEDPLPPSNIVRNILDMNALHGGLNSALLDGKKSVWVMNVVPRSGLDTLSLIYKRGLIGLQHDWCEAFPVYPRTFDLLHGIGLLSQEFGRFNGCGLSTLFLEMDRILRPEGWVILRDKVELIEDARVAAGQMRWESRVINVEGLEDQQLLICQKTFWKNQPSNAVL